MEGGDQPSTVGVPEGKWGNEDRPRERLQSRVSPLCSRRMPTAPPVRYTIFPKHPEAHLFEVSCTVHDPDPQGQRFALPA